MSPNVFAFAIAGFPFVRFENLLAMLVVRFIWQPLSG